jgi:hypothetical protein
MRLASLLASVAFLLLVPAAPADDEPPVDEVFRSNTEEVVRGAATLVGAGCQRGHGSAMVLGLLLQGDRLHLWKLEEGNRAPELRAGPLRKVRDSTGVRIGDDAGEMEAYCEALYKASLASPGAFANSARRDLTLAHLLNEPQRYRGEVIHFEGEVRRIRRFDPPGMLEGQGIHDLYECWLFDRRYGTHPVCLVCTELPPGVQPGEQLSIEASFDAYFFKKYRYESADSKPGYLRQAPLFLGRSFALTRPIVAAPQPDDAFASGSHSALVIFLGIVVAVLVLAVAGTWLYTRADRRVQERIKLARLRQFEGPEGEGMPGATPSAN